jgi:hypothetical protein
MEEALLDVQVFPPKEFMNTSGRPGHRNSENVRLWTVREHILLVRTVQRALAERVSKQALIEQAIPSKLNVAPSDILEYLIGLNFPVKEITITVDETISSDKRRKELHSLGYKRGRKNRCDSDISDGSLDAESIRGIFKRGPFSEPVPKTEQSEPIEESTSTLTLLRGPKKS